MSEVNMEYWNQLAKPPESALKTIKAGRLRGFTDINPQWRMEAMTRVFGPCGHNGGWRYEIERLWKETCGDEVLTFAQINLFTWEDLDDDLGGAWSNPIPGIGGSKLIAKETSGLYNNDEAFKMALTDALSVAMKALGVGAEIYAGRWDGNRYHLRPEDVITQEQLDQLKLNWHRRDSERLSKMDKPKQASEFAIWCRDVIGEDVNYTDPARWQRAWYEACWDALSGIDEDVPFEGAD